jgi:predicted transcriptional regulator
MTTFTSTLPEELLARLDKAAKKLSVPKNRLIEKALSIYLDQLTKAEYIKSFRRAPEDDDLLNMAEEGMEDYFKQLEE